MLDLHMMIITGGRARSLAEFEALLAEAGLKRSKTTADELRSFRHRGISKLSGSSVFT